MRTLTITSQASVLCAALIAIYSVPQLVLNGIIEINSGFELMVVFPTLIGVLCSLVGALIGLIALMRRRHLGKPGTLLAAGQITTWALAIAIIVWATTFASTGWELIALPYSLMLGQLVVLAGLISTKIGQR